MNIGQTDLVESYNTGYLSPRDNPIYLTPKDRYGGALMATINFYRSGTLEEDKKRRFLL